MGESPLYDVAVLAAIVWVLAVARVVFALLQHEPGSREVAVAWIIVFVAPRIVWGEIRAQRR